MNTKQYKNFRVEIDRRGVVTITLDVLGHPLNVLNESVMQELALIVTDLEYAPDARLVVIRSGKESGFLAGADVHVIAGIQSSEQAEALIDTGQKLFARIEALPMPTLVVIHGACLGGGLEMSLACTYRIAMNNSSTQIGLPEIKLGVIPGWGGTQRLPRKIGLSTALSMILKGQLLDADKALRVGLIDRAIDPNAWDEGVDGFVNEVLAAKPEGLRPAANNGPQRRPFWQRCLEHNAVGRWLILQSVQRSIASQIHQYPALGSAVKAVSLSYTHGVDGFAFERREFSWLLMTPTCRNLLGLFFARETARQLKTWSKDVSQAVHDDPIRKVGIVGAGAMGAGIGQLAASRGFDVVLKEIDDQALAAGRERIGKLVDELAKRKHFSESQRAELMSMITLSCDDSSLADADLVIEAVVERKDVKQHVFESLDSVVKPSGILASNTSSLSVSQMATATKRPGAVAGLHFFNPVHRMELVEVVRAKQTDEATIARLVAFVRALGKTPVVTADAPGFLVNRVLFPYLGEAVLMVTEAFDVRKIDHELRQFGMPMGPLELLDQVGIDVAHHVAHSLESILPGVGHVVDTLDAMVRKGQLGKKSGQGFYRYKNEKRGLPASVEHLIVTPMKSDSNADFLNDAMTPIQRRLVYPMLAEAMRCHEEHVVEQPWAIDLAMVLGTGFAPHHGGPLHIVDAIGQATVLTNLRRLQTELGDRFSPPDNLVDMANHNQRFFESDQTQQIVSGTR